LCERAAIVNLACFAETMMTTPDTPVVTEAMKLGLQNAAHRTACEVSLRARVAALRAQALAKAARPKLPALSERDAFWTR
jgi:antitoxin VapB